MDLNGPEKEHNPRRHKGDEHSSIFAPGLESDGDAAEEQKEENDRVEKRFCGDINIRRRPPGAAGDERGPMVAMAGRVNAMSLAMCDQPKRASKIPGMLSVSPMTIQGQ